MKNTIMTIEELRRVINSGDIPMAEFEWNLHSDILIIDKEIPKEEFGYYGGPPDYLLTPYFREVSWMMERLTEIFWSEPPKGCGDRYMFFVPVCETGMDIVAKNPNASAKEICIPMIDKAEQILSQGIEGGSN